MVNSSKPQEETAMPKPSFFFYSALLIATLIGLAGCGDNAADTADTQTTFDTGDATPDAGDATPDAGDTTPEGQEESTSIPDSSSNGGGEPHCDPFEETYLECVDDAVFVYGPVGSGFGDACYGLKKLFDCPAGCNFTGTIREDEFEAQFGCIDVYMCDIDACNPEERADADDSGI